MASLHRSIEQRLKDARYDRTGAYIVRVSAAAGDVLYPDLIDWAELKVDNLGKVRMDDLNGYATVGITD